MMKSENIYPYYENPHAVLGNREKGGGVAEAMLYDMLRSQLPEDYYMLHGIKIINSEFDFIVIVPQFGCVVLECKGTGYDPVTGKTGVFRHERDSNKTKDLLGQTIAEQNFLRQYVCEDILGLTETEFKKGGLYSSALVFPISSIDKKERTAVHIYDKEDCAPDGKIGMLKIIESCIEDTKKELKARLRLKKLTSISQDYIKKIFNYFKGDKNPENSACNSTKESRCDTVRSASLSPSEVSPSEKAIATCKTSDHCLCMPAIDSQSLPPLSSKNSQSECTTIKSVENKTINCIDIKLRAKILKSFVTYVIFDEAIEISELDRRFTDTTGIIVTDFLGMTLKELQRTPIGFEFFDWEWVGEFQQKLTVAAKRPSKPIEVSDELMSQLAECLGDDTPERFPFELLARQAKFPVETIYVAYLLSLKKKSQTLKNNENKTNTEQETGGKKLDTTPRVTDIRRKTGIRENANAQTKTPHRKKVSTGKKTSTEKQNAGKAKCTKRKANPISKDGTERGKSPKKNKIANGKLDSDHKMKCGKKKTVTSSRRKSSHKKSSGKNSGKIIKKGK